MILQIFAKSPYFFLYVQTLDFYDWLSKNYDAKPNNNFHVCPIPTLHLPYVKFIYAM